MLLEPTNDDLHTDVVQPLRKKALEFLLLELHDWNLRDHEPGVGRRFRPDGLSYIAA